MYARDFKQIADAIAEEFSNSSVHQQRALEILTENLCQRFSAIQPNFNREKFIRRTGIRQEYTRKFRREQMQ